MSYNFRNFRKYFHSKITTYTVIAKDHNNARCSKGGSRIIAQVQTRKGDVVPVEVKDNKDGSYLTSFVPSKLERLNYRSLLKENILKVVPTVLWCTKITKA